MPPARLETRAAAPTKRRRVIAQFAIRTAQIRDPGRTFQ